MKLDRMIHRAVEYVHANRKAGDLLMDTPVGCSWQELVKRASNRKSWRSKVQWLRQPPRFEVTMNSDVPGARVKPRQQPQIPPHAETKMSTSAKTYLDRDAHEMFFRPKCKPINHKHNTRSKASKQAKTRPLTDKQRAQ